MDNLLNLNGKTAIVLGAVGNLGTFIAKKLYEHGANIVFNYYNGEEEKAAAFAKELDKFGTKSLMAYCDINDENSVEQFVKAGADKFGTIDIMINLVHNPDYPLKPVHDMEWKDWGQHLLAQKGHFLICKHVLPYMRKQHYGRIIYISGGLAVRHIPGSSAFAGVKAGMGAFCKTMAMEEGPNGITVNIVSPGKITSIATEGDYSWAEEENELLQKTPLRRFATQDDVANTVLYFASPLADAMTGQTLYVACGELMY